MSCLKKKPKPLMPVKKLDVIFRRRYVPNTQYYFTDRKYAIKGDEQNVVVYPPRHFKVPKSDKILSYTKYIDKKEKIQSKEMRSQPLYKKVNLKTAASKDISQRLFIEEPPDDVRAVIEKHPEFNTAIEGRPVRVFDDIKVYINNIRGYAMSKQQIGYRQDIIMKIDKWIHDESTEYARIEGDLMQQIKKFQKFMTEDYQKACRKVAESEILQFKLEKKNFEYLEYAFAATQLMNTLYKLDTIRDTLKLFRSYLDFVAPFSWRQVYDANFYNKRLSQVYLKTEKFATDHEVQQLLDPDDIVQLAKIELSDPPPVHIYFTEPSQMMNLFRIMEEQSGEYLQRLSQADVPFRRYQERIRQLKRLTKYQEEDFEYYINKLKCEIAIVESNGNHLKKNFMSILHKTFFNCISSPDTLKLKICLEYVYEQIFGKCEEGHNNLHDPMKTLEKTYEKYNMLLDSLDYCVVKKATKELFAQDLQMMRNAHKAQRELRSFQEMTNATQKAFLPPLTYKRPEFVKLKKKKKTSKVSTTKITVPQKYKLSPEERDGLIMFTEWCEGKDPRPYLEEYHKYVIPVFENCFFELPIITNDIE